ncbi:MAG: hypothetical protein ACE5JP_18055, partial [Candidatus Bipolaricaulia bacterium]
MTELVRSARLMPIVTACYGSQPIGRSFFFELACFSSGQMRGGLNLEQFSVADLGSGFKKMGGQEGGNGVLVGGGRKRFRTSDPLLV